MGGTGGAGGTKGVRIHPPIHQKSSLPASPRADFQRHHRYRLRNISPLTYMALRSPTLDWTRPTRPRTVNQPHDISNDSRLKTPQGG